MERLKQLIEKLKTEVDSGAGMEQLMETVFDITRSVMEKKQIMENQGVDANSTTSIEVQKRPPDQVSMKVEVNHDQPDLAEKLSQQPIDSIRSAMGINEKYIFLQAFFKGEANSFEHMMVAIDGAKGYEEAKLILEEYLPVVPMNDEQLQILEKFDYLLRRRFFSI
ncbi:MAG: hypothetical protein ACK5AO_00090 [bacterium]|jgi:hypothetical protein